MEIELCSQPDFRITVRYIYVVSAFSNSRLLDK